MDGRKMNVVMMDCTNVFRVVRNEQNVRSREWKIPDRIIDTHEIGNGVADI